MDITASAGRNPPSPARGGIWHYVGLKVHPFCHKMHLVCKKSVGALGRNRVLKKYSVSSALKAGGTLT